MIFKISKNINAKNLFFIICSICVCIVWFDNLNKRYQNEIGINRRIDLEAINIIIGICGSDVIPDANNLIKSVLMFTKKRVNFKILTKGLQNELRAMFETYPKAIMEKITFDIREFYFKGYKQDWDNEMWKCGNFRLFIPEIFTEIEYAIYVDIDCVFFDSVDNLWMQFENMNSSQMIGIVEEANGHFNRTWRKFQGIAARYGVNSGLMLMNLAKMREFKWVDKVIYTFEHSKNYFADMGIVNIILSENPDKYLLLSCRWNYYKEFCWLPNQECQDMLSNGLGLYHRVSARKVKTQDSLAEAIYYAYENYNLTSDFKTYFLDPLTIGLNKYANKSKCPHTVKNLVITFQIFASKAIQNSAN